MTLKKIKIEKGLRDIRKKAIIAYDHCYAANYTNDVKMFLKSIIEKSTEVLQLMEGLSR